MAHLELKDLQTVKEIGKGRQGRTELMKTTMYS